MIYDNKLAPKIKKIVFYVVHHLEFMINAADSTVAFNFKLSTNKNYDKSNKKKLIKFNQKKKLVSDGELFGRKFKKVLGQRVDRL